MAGFQMSTEIIVVGDGRDNRSRRAIDHLCRLDKMLDRAGSEPYSCREAAAERGQLHDVAGTRAGSTLRAAPKNADQAVRRAAQNESLQRVASGRVRQRRPELRD